MTPENATSTSRQAPVLTPENKALLDEYATYLSHVMSGHAPRTYLGAVRGYLAWLESATVDGDPLADATAKNWAVKDYRSHLVAVAKRAPATVNKVLAALDNFYVWRGMGECGNGNGKRIKRQEIPEHAPKALDERSSRRYLRAVQACPSARDRAIALVPFYAGARIAEVAALDVGDVKISARKGSLHLVGKGEKSRDVPLHPELREALQTWLAERPETTDRALFTSRRGGTRLTTDAIDDVISGVVRAAGLEDHITAHVLRHTYATRMLRQGADIVTVNKALGHALLETTRIYVRPSEDDLERAVMTLVVDN